MLSYGKGGAFCTDTKGKVQMKLLTYSIMPLDVDHIDELCEDIKLQYENGIASCALFSMTLVAEGIPPVDKVGVLCEKYRIIKEKLDSMGLISGVLVQASIGHGYALNAPMPFPKFIGLADGKEYNVSCPYSEGFRDYIKNAMRTIASHHPSMIMVDDDFRLIFRPAKGCACDMHMKEFSKRYGKNITREELWNAIGTNAPESRALADIYVSTQEDSLIGAARAMREGIDEIDPSIPGSFCTCGPNVEAAGDIAKILAGKGNPVIVRLNNGAYLAGGGREYSNVFFRAATQLEKLKDVADYVLDEPDTCPQNRYSTGASALHAHYAGTIIEGARGAKHWITRLAAHEPKSGVAYRKKLAKYKGYYEALADIAPTLKWKGCRIPLSKVPYYDFEAYWLSSNQEYWSGNVLERLGLPIYFSSKNGGAVFMEGDISHRKFGDEEILKMLSGTLILSSDAAKALIGRGFKEYIGVDVREWKGLPVSTEKLYINGNRCTAQYKPMELVPLSDDVKIDSMMCNTVDRYNLTPLFPGSTVYKNSLGGTVIVFCGTPNTEVFSYGAPFSMLNESRKAQFVKLLSDAGELPMYFEGDTEAYLKVADTSDNKTFVFFMNLNMDTLDEITLATDKKYSAAKILMPDGSWENVPIHTENGILTVDCEAKLLDPVALVVE